jgi:hypothetical protein
MSNLITIKAVNDLSTTDYYNVPMEEVLMSSLYILRTPTHFRPIKNRFQKIDNAELIPNFMLRAYLDRFLTKYKDDYIFNLVGNENY